MIANGKYNPCLCNPIRFYIFFKTIYMTIKITCITAFLIFLSHIGVSQLLLGKVRSESGAGASYVTVNFKNKKNNVVTNADGTFRIMATRLPDTLIFSSPGYEPYNVIVTEKNIKDPNFEVVLLNKRNFYAKYTQYS